VSDSPPHTIAERLNLAVGLSRARATIEPRLRPLVRVLATITPLGAIVLIGGIAAWVLGAVLGWPELLIIGCAALLLFVLAVLFTIGRTRLRAQLDLNPRRVVAGNPSAGRLQLTNIARRRLMPTTVEVPIGVSAAQFGLPSLAPGATHEELFVVSTSRRGVIEVGPARTVRGDPIGLLRRAATWTSAIELCVHPITVPLEPLGAGLLRDLEGTTTNETSMSDLAFHTLREYSPGDDRRYIHWRSSAKVSAASGAGTFLVRQFLDTRRSHLAVLVDSDAGSYLDVIDFETAISAAASVVLRAMIDEMQTTVLVGRHVAHEAEPQRTMDAFARADFTSTRLATLAERAVQLAPETSVAVLVTGANSSFRDLQRAASHFAAEVNVIALRVDPTRGGGITSVAGLTVLNLPQLSGLATLLAGAIG
jgi:uncharacterized protein (DUF58 family)